MSRTPSQRAALYSVCAVGFAYSANYTNHAPMTSALRGEFHISQADAGLLTSAVFLTHALMQIPGGRLADRVGPSRVILAALAWVCAGSLGIAFAQAWWHLLFWKAFTGIGTGACFAAGARYTVSSFTGRDLHTAQGLYGGSVVLGSGFVIFGVPWMLASFGWRGAFLCCTAVGALVWIAWILAAPRPEHPVKIPGSLSDVIGSRDLWLLGLIQMASFGLVIVVGSWITTLLTTTFQLPLKTAGLLGSLVLLLGIFTRPAGGWLVQRIPVRKLILSALLCNTAACLALASAHSLPITFLAILILGAGCGLPYAGVFNRAAALFPGRAGAAMGLVNMIGISMILAGAPAVGYFADRTGNFRVSFLALGVFSLAAALTSITIREKA